VNFLLGFLILCIFLFSSGHHPDGNWIALPLIFFLQLIFTSGLSFFCSTLNLFFRDIVHLIGVILMVWLYLTPVFYPETLVPVRFHYALYFNPMAHLVSLFRNILLLDTIPVKSLSVFSIFAFSFFIGGFFLFSHQERIMSDYL
jgi:ABC-type polysaccharide/polyol phosphate export permease